MLHRLFEDNLKKGKFMEDEEDLGIDFFLMELIFSLSLSWYFCLILGVLNLLSLLFIFYVNFLYTVSSFNSQVLLSYNLEFPRDLIITTLHQFPLTHTTFMTLRIAYPFLLLILSFLTSVVSLYNCSGRWNDWPNSFSFSKILFNTKQVVHGLSIPY